MIDYIFYINLDEKPNKKEHIESLLSQFDIPYERFAGIKPSLEECLAMKNVVPRIQEYLHHPEKYPRGIGVLGCYLSHTMTMNKCKKLPKKHKHILILEDDAIFTQKDMDYINDKINMLNEQHDWDVLRVLLPRTESFLERGIENVDGDVYKFVGNHVLSKFDSSNRNVINGGCHFYVLNRKNITKISQYVKKEDIFNIDSIYSTKELNIYFLISSSIQSGMRNESSIPKL